MIRNNQFAARTRTVKDYLSFILAMIIGLFRLEEGEDEHRFLLCLSTFDLPRSESSMKMIQMLQIQEHPVTIFSAAVVCHVKHFRSDSLLERIIA